MIMHNIEKLYSTPKYIQINTVHADAMISVMKEIKSGNIYDRLNKNPIADPNCIYNIIYKEITRAKTIHMPNKFVIFNRYKHKESTWITPGLLTSIRYRDKMTNKININKSLFK